MLGLTDAPVRLDDSGLRSVLAADVTIRSIERFEKPLWQGRTFQLLAGAKAQAGERISRAWPAASRAKAKTSSSWILGRTRGRGAFDEPQGPPDSRGWTGPGGPMQRRRRERTS